MTADELDADLNYLLRHGCVQIDQSDDASAVRYQITVRGRSYVQETDHDDQSSRCADVDDAGSSETTQRRVG